MRRVTRLLGYLALLPACACVLAIMWTAGQEILLPSGAELSLLEPVIDGLLAAIILAIFRGILSYLPLRPAIGTAAACIATITLLLVLNFNSASSLNLTERTSGVLVFDHGQITIKGFAYLVAHLGFMSLALPLARALGRPKLDVLR